MVLPNQHSKRASFALPLWQEGHFPFKFSEQEWHRQSASLEEVIASTRVPQILWASSETVQFEQQDRMRAGVCSPPAAKAIANCTSAAAALRERGCVAEDTGGKQQLNVLQQP